MQIPIIAFILYDLISEHLSSSSNIFRVFGSPTPISTRHSLFFHLHLFFLHLSALVYSTLLYSTILYFTILYSTLLYSTLLYNTILYSTILYYTLLFFLSYRSTTLYSTLSYPILSYPIVFILFFPILTIFRFYDVCPWICILSLLLLLYFTSHYCLLICSPRRFTLTPSGAKNVHGQPKSWSFEKKRFTKKNLEFTSVNQKFSGRKVCSKTSLVYFLLLFFDVFLLYFFVPTQQL